MKLTVKFNLYSTFYHEHYRKATLQKPRSKPPNEQASGKRNKGKETLLQKNLKRSRLKSLAFLSPSTQVHYHYCWWYGE